MLPWLVPSDTFTASAPASTSLVDIPAIAVSVWAETPSCAPGTVTVGASSTEATVMVWFDPALWWLADWPSSAVKVTVRAVVDGVADGAVGAGGIVAAVEIGDGIQHLLVMRLGVAVRQRQHAAGGVVRGGDAGAGGIGAQHVLAGRKAARDRDGGGGHVG